MLALACAPSPAPHFEVRNLELKTEKESYGTLYRYEGSVLETSPGTDTRDYEVLVEIVRLSDGQPDFWPRDTVRTSVVVHRGYGLLSWPGGMSSSTAGIDPGWKPARLQVRVIGYQSFVPVVPRGSQ